MFQTRADFWGDGKVKEITIEKSGKNVFVNGVKAEMTYNHIQLRFTTPKGHYIIFDDRHHPPKPIAEMFRLLGGKAKSKPKRKTKA